MKCERCLSEMHLHIPDFMGLGQVWRCAKCSDSVIVRIVWDKKEDDCDE